MSSFYDALLRQYATGVNSSQPMIQQTPKQIAESQQAQAYQTFLATKEGVEALNEVQVKFTTWYDENYGVKKTESSKEVLELKEMVAQMAKQNEMMAKQMETLTNQFK